MIRIIGHCSHMNKLLYFTRTFLVLNKYFKMSKSTFLLFFLCIIHSLVISKKLIQHKW